MKYGELNLGQIEALVNKLGGMEGVKQFLSGKTVVRAAAEERVLLSLWKTIKLGTGLKTADDFRHALLDGGFEIGFEVNEIFSFGFGVSKIEKEVDLVSVSGAELGFPDKVYRDDIYQRALELGLKLCPPEVGPQLRLQYRNQPFGDTRFIAMKPLQDDMGDEQVFCVARAVSENGGGRFLGGESAHPDYLWDGDCQWVFLRRK